MGLRAVDTARAVERGRQVQPARDRGDRRPTRQRPIMVPTQPASRASRPPTGGLVLLAAAILCLPPALRAAADGPATAAGVQRGSPAVRSGSLSSAWRRAVTMSSPAAALAG